jgi:hypothetical protein
MHELRVHFYEYSFSEYAFDYENFFAAQVMLAVGPSGLIKLCTDYVHRN